MGNTSKFEIERKYLLKSIPDKLDRYRHIEIEQGYISTVPVVRIRKKITHPGDMDTTGTAVNGSYVLTIKSSGMLSRQEYEMDITAAEYDNLSKKVEGNIITKTRYIIPLTDIVDVKSMSIPENLYLELDVFQGAFNGLVMGEVEFPDKKTADSFETAGVFSYKLFNEVTFDKRFHNSTMSAMSQTEIDNFIKDIS